jgi:hypothetical protein
MSHLVERLNELLRHLAHLRELRPRVTTPEELRRNCRSTTTCSSL